MDDLIIGDRVVGAGQPVFIIAELSANHGGLLDRAIELVDAAAEAGADAVKLQTYTPETMTIDGTDERLRVGEGTPWEGQRLFDLYEQARTPWDWYPSLDERARMHGMTLFSTPFDATAVDFLDAHDTPAFKIASFELVDLPLIRYAASKSRPLVISTGMATADEIDDAVSAARASGTNEVALLRCNSAYPAAAAEMDLLTIPDMRARWDVQVGLSDHTLGTTAAVAATALGVTIIEKHVTMSRAEPGPDSSFSLEPREFAQLVVAVRETEAALGSVRYGPSASEASSLAFRRSLYVVADLAAGDVFTETNIRALRPAGGLPPRELDRIVGRHASVQIRHGTPLTNELVSD